MLSANLAADAAIDAHPGLSALVVYLRPSRRSHLLGVLAELGVFVNELLPGPPEWSLGLSPGARADMAVVVGDTVPDHLAVLRHLREHVSQALFAVGPPGSDVDAFVRAGAIAAVAEDVPGERFSAALLPVARVARQLRAEAVMAPEVVVFGDVRFRVRPPQLVRDGRSVSLSPPEREVLLRLSESLGEPVESAELERRVAPRTGAPVSSGYLKTVVLRLRRKVEEVGGNPVMLGSVRGFGYVLHR